MKEKIADLYIYLPSLFPGRQRNGKLRKSTDVLDADTQLVDAIYCKI